MNFPQNFVALGFGLFSILLILVQKCQGSDHHLSVSPNLYISYGAPARGIGQHPNCGEDLTKFDQLCCEEGDRILEEDVRKLSRQGWDAQSRATLVWIPVSKFGADYSELESESGSRGGSCLLSSSIAHHGGQHNQGGRGPGGSATLGIEDCATKLNKKDCCTGLAAQSCRWYATIKQCGVSITKEQKGSFGTSLVARQRCS